MVNWLAGNMAKYKTRNPKLQILNAKTETPGLSTQRLTHELAPDDRAKNHRFAR